MPFWVCYYHVVWATRNRAPIITSPMEGIIYDAIRAKSEELDCPVSAINGISDHLHVAVRIKPSMAVGTWVSQVKGASSRTINMAQNPDAERFHWQGGYGVLTFGVKNLPFVIEYIARQKEHHQNDTLQPYLERMDEEE